MARYLVNTNPQPTGEHEVHTYTCSYLPAVQNRKDLGEFATCHGALAEAKKTYPNSDGCYYCCPDCHKK